MEQKFKTYKQDIFTIVEHNELEKKVFTICIGNYVLSVKNFPSLKAAKDYIASKPYDLIINAACLCAELSKNEPNKETEAKQ